MSFRACAGSVSSVSVDAYLEDGSLETFQNYTLGNYNWLLDSVVRQALYDTRNIAEFRRDYAVPLCVDVSVGRVRVPGSSWLCSLSRREARPCAQASSDGESMALG